MSIGKNLREAREESKMTLEEVAKIVGVSRYVGAVQEGSGVGMRDTALPY